MKQLLSIAILLTISFSCKKQISSTVVFGRQVSSNAVERLPYIEIIPFDQIILSSCTNEDVHLLGELKFSYNLVNIDNGIFHFNGQTRYNKISATGLTTGNKYIYVGNQSAINNGTATTGPFISQSKFIFMSPASGVKEVLTTSVHVVANAQGEIVVESVEFSFDCE